MNQADVSVIIVNFNCGPLLTQCVESVLASTVSIEVFVSDNGSTDGSIELLERKVFDERLHIILNSENLGFAKGSNIPLKQACGDYLLFLNPDCIIQPDTIEKMIFTMQEHPDAGMSGCLILNSDGSEQAGCRRRVPTPARSLIRMLHLDKPFPFLREKGVSLTEQPLPEFPVEMEAISGAFMLVSRKALEDVGPLDEGYFLHCEDLDWCMRFRSHGWKILFVPDVAVMHAKGECSKGRAVRVEWHKHKGMVRFYRKFFRHQYPALLMWFVITAVWVRFFLLSIVLTVRGLLR
ncbi:MAG: glycosyltransferase family 2 protein [Zetaproteobacteria bacterium]|nr:glycosyltransferase family 2 protein [Zetaproteobacteria bacterium]